MKDRTLRERVARFIRRRLTTGHKPDKIALELGRGALGLMRLVGDSEEGDPAHTIILRRTPNDGVSMELPFIGHKAITIPDNDMPDMAMLAEAFGAMSISPGSAYHVKIDDDGNGFTVMEVNGVSPEMTQTALEAAARQFGFYETQHRAKGTPDGDEKASVNHEMKLLMERALGNEVYAPGQMGFLPIGPDSNGFEVAVEMLVERGYEQSISSHAMTDALRRSADLIEECRAEQPQILPETAQESDSDDLAPSAPLASAAAILAWLRGKAEFARKRGDTDIQRILLALVEGIEKDLVDDLPIDPETALRKLYEDCHARNVKAGWWSDLATGMPKKRSVGELFVLMVTELAEAYRAYLANDMDDKLPHLPGLGVELGDVQIRLADFCGALLAGSVVEHSGAFNPGDQMFREIVEIAERYEAIRKTDAAQGAPEEGEAIPSQDVAAMTFEKLAFNAKRPDHKIENRLKEDGKRT